MPALPLLAESCHAPPSLPRLASPSQAVPRLACLACPAVPCHALPGLAVPCLPRLALSLKRLDCAVCCMQCLQGNGDAGEPVAVRIVLLPGYVLQCPGGGFSGLGALEEVVEG